MESFIDEIRDVIAKYKAIASARVTAFISSVKVAWANFRKNPDVGLASELVEQKITRAKPKKKAKKNG